MTAYVSTKDLKEIPLKTWVPETTSERIDRHRKRLHMGKSEFIRRAIELAIARFDEEGYSSLYED